MCGPICYKSKKKSFTRTTSPTIVEENILILIWSAGLARFWKHLFCELIKIKILKLNYIWPKAVNIKTAEHLEIHTQTLNQPCEITLIGHNQIVACFLWTNRCVCTHTHACTLTDTHTNRQETGERSKKISHASSHLIVFFINITIKGNSHISLRADWNHWNFIHMNSGMADDRSWDFVDVWASVICLSESVMIGDEDLKPGTNQRRKQSQNNTNKTKNAVFWCHYQLQITHIWWLPRQTACYHL